MKSRSSQHVSPPMRKFWYTFQPDGSLDIVYEVHTVWTGPFETRLEALEDAFKIAEETRTFWQDNVAVARQEIDKHKANLKKEKRTFLPEDVKKAFEKHKHNLKAVDHSQYCGPERSGPPLLGIMNEGVFMRMMMLELGYTEEEIKKA